MKVSNANLLAVQIDSVLNVALRQTGRTEVVSDADATLYVPQGIKVEDGTTQFSFFKDTKGTWRLSSVSSWGNYEGVYGQGCDASGFVITDHDTVDTLEFLTGEER